jgi:hypothetical protein
MRHHVLPALLCAFLIFVPGCADGPLEDVVPAPSDDFLGVGEEEPEDDGTQDDSNAGEPNAGEPGEGEPNAGEPGEGEPDEGDPDEGDDFEDDFDDDDDFDDEDFEEDPESEDTGECVFPLQCVDTPGDCIGEVVGSVSCGPTPGVCCDPFAGEDEETDPDQNPDPPDAEPITRDAFCDKILECVMPEGSLPSDCHEVYDDAYCGSWDPYLRCMRGCLAVECNPDDFDPDFLLCEGDCFDDYCG